ARVRWCAGIRPSALLVLLLVLAGIPNAAMGFQPRREPSRFDALVIEDPAQKVSVSSVPVRSTIVPDSLRSGWSGFRKAHGEGWQVFLDARSGAPLLAQG